VTYITDKGRVYKEKAGWTAAALIGSTGLLQGPLRVTIRAYRPRAIGDVDNIIKALLDSCNKTLWTDDRQIKHLEIDVYDDKDRPRVEMEVGPL